MCVRWWLGRLECGVGCGVEERRGYFGKWNFSRKKGLTVRDLWFFRYAELVLLVCTLSELGVVV